MSNIILPPAVFAETPSPKMSAKYAHVRTADILETFQDQGWQVRQTSSPKYSKAPQFARHALRLRHRDFLEATMDSTVPELIILNSHNGSWALRIALGMFRMVCANGMVAGNIWGGETIRHTNLHNLEDRVKHVTGQMGDMAQRMTGMINDWDRLEVPLERQLAFADQAKAIRWGKNNPVDGSMLLEARREADKGNSLWKVFNRVQENLTQGGYNGSTSSGRTFAVKAIKNVKRDFNYNRDLMNAANDLAAELVSA